MTNNGGLCYQNQYTYSFFFLDEYFEVKLQKNEPIMWRLIKNESNILSDIPIQVTVPSKIIYATDLMVDLFRLVFRLDK